MSTKARVMAVLIAGALTVGMVGCSNASSGAGNAEEPKDNGNASASVQETQPAEPQDLVLVDSNYVLSNGYIHYALEIQNPNTDYAAEFVNVTVTSKHADGTIGFSDEWVVSSVMPGSTTYWANQAGHGETVETDTIEISLSVSDRNWEKTDQTMPIDLYTFSNVTVEPDQYGHLSAKGEMTLNEEFKVGVMSAETPMIVCILKDANGSIVTGFNGYMSKDLTVGAPTVFDISANFDAGEYVTAEMHANVW